MTKLDCLFLQNIPLPFLEFLKRIWQKLWGFSCSWLVGAYRSIDVHKYGPKKFVNRAAEDHYRTELANTLTILPPEPSKIVCMSEYIEYLKSRFPLYQSTWFFVKVRFMFSSQIFSHFSWVQKFQVLWILSTTFNVRAVTFIEHVSTTCISG